MIDADALLDSEKATGFVVGGRGCGKSLLAACRQYLHSRVINAPTIDAVPVVRCKDCKHFARCEEVEGVSWTGFCNYGEFHTDEEDFCSRGERRSDD